MGLTGPSRHRVWSLPLWVGLGSPPEQEPPAPPGWEPGLRARAFPVPLPLTGQEASRVPSPDSPGVAKVPAAWRPLLSGPFLPLGPHVGYLMAFWPVCIQQAPPQAAHMMEAPWACPWQRSTEARSVPGGSWKNPLCPAEQEVPSASSCPGLCWAET